MINPKKYFAIIEAISSTLGRFREKNLEKQKMTLSQKKYVNTLYTECIDHLKVYDNFSTFESLRKTGTKIKHNFFYRILLTRKGLVDRYLTIINNIQTVLMNKNQVDEIRREM